ncbi:hypothetical protein L7F22_029960 [Adiantum nelumboides]|nr:hypothetical protein [Adiantum nelumboides]
MTEVFNDVQSLQNEKEKIEDELESAKDEMVEFKAILELHELTIQRLRATPRASRASVGANNQMIFEACKYVQNTDEAYKKIKLTLEKTQSKQKKAADRHRRELVFSLGDWVLLRFEKARLRKMKGKERLFPKLDMRYYGPFQVCDKISDVAYRLKLPEGWKIHNAFHVSLLRPFVGDVPEDRNSLKWKN